MFTDATNVKIECDIDDSSIDQLAVEFEDEDTDEESNSSLVPPRKKGTSRNWASKQNQSTTSTKRNSGKTGKGKRQKRKRKTLSHQLTTEQCLQLIAAVEQRPCLWDITSAEYKGRNVREQSRYDISDLMGIPVDDISAKWTLLRQQYRNARARVVSSKNGEETALRHPPNEFYAAMKFLEPIIYIEASKDHHPDDPLMENETTAAVSIPANTTEPVIVDQATSSSSGPVRVRRRKPLMHGGEEASFHQHLMDNNSNVPSEQLDVSTNAHEHEDDELGIFGKFISSQIRQAGLPKNARLQLQRKINRVMLDYLDEHDSR